MVLKDTCPEVTPYNRDPVQPPADEFDEAEHYDERAQPHSTSVADIETCVAHAFNRSRPVRPGDRSRPTEQRQPQDAGVHWPVKACRPNQYRVVGRAMVTDVPITYLGYVDRGAGEIDEPDSSWTVARRGQGPDLPERSGSTVAPTS